MSKTIEQVRDELAEMLPEKWIKQKPHGDFISAVDPMKWLHPDEHPVPLTLDALAAMMPEGWDWQRVYEHGKYTWYSSGQIDGAWSRAAVPDTGNHAADMLRLLHAVYSHLSATPGEKR